MKPTVIWLLPRGVTLWSSGTGCIRASLRLYMVGQLAIADSDGEIIRVLYSSEEEDARPPVLGNIESTGVPTTTVLQGDKWDKVQSSIASTNSSNQ